VGASAEEPPCWGKDRRRDAGLWNNPDTPTSCLFPSTTSELGILVHIRKRNTHPALFMITLSEEAIQKQLAL
jgi:hypothetical protein